MPINNALSEMDILKNEQESKVATIQPLSTEKVPASNSKLHQPHTTAIPYGREMSPPNMKTPTGDPTAFNRIPTEQELDQLHGKPLVPKNPTDTMDPNFVFGMDDPNKDKKLIEDSAEKQQKDMADARQVQEEIATGAMDYLAKNDLLNTHTPEDIYLRNEDGTPKLDPETSEPLLRPELSAEQIEAGRIATGPAAQATAGQAVASFGSASEAQAYLASVENATTLTAQDHQNIQAARDVIVREFEAETIPLEDVGKSLDRIRDIKPMEAASTAEKLNELLDGMENGDIPMWARPAVTKVEQQLASKGIAASSVGRDSLFNAIIGAAMPIAQADASFEQQANQTNYSAKVNAILSDESQRFAARQFNANSINQTNQFISNLKAQVDMQNAARKDNMAQFNSQQKNAMEQFNVDQQNTTSRFNTEQANRTALANAAQQSQTSLANAQMQTQVSLANADAATRVSLGNAQMQTQVTIANAQAANQMAMHQASLDSQREQFNAQNANAIAQADVAWRRQLNTMETAAINAANQANVSNAFNLTNQAQQNLWQEMRDNAHWDFQASENELARKHEGAMRLLVADIEAGRAEGAVPSKWDQVKDSLITKGIDAATDWLLGD